MIEKNLINGEWYDTTETIPVYDPATKELLGHVPASSAEDAQRSVDAASEAFVKWSNETADTRANLVDAWYRLINENREELARIMTTEQGNRTSKHLAKSITAINTSVGTLKKHVGFTVKRFRLLFQETTLRRKRTGRCRRSDHTMELPGSDDHTQTCTGSCSGLYDCP